MSTTAATKPVSFQTGEPVLRLKNRQLFLDDFVVSETTDLKRTVNQPKKYDGNPVVVADRAWEENQVELPGSPQVVYDPREDIFRMYYVMSLTLDRPHAYRCCYAESRDGLDWTKPALGVSKYEGSLDNNLIGYNESLWVRRPSVILDTREPDPERRYKMLYVTLTKTEHPRRTISMRAYSADGKRWRMNQGPSVRFGAPGQTFLGWVDDLNKWVLYPRPVIPKLSLGSVLRGFKNTFLGGFAAGWDTTFGTRYGFYDHPGIRTIHRSESADLESWTEPEPVLVPDQKDPLRTQFSSMPVMAYEGIYIGFPIVYQLSTSGEIVERTEGIVHAQLAVSRDTKNWQRVADRQPFLSPGDKEFELCATYPTAPVVAHNQVFVYYGGYNFIAAEDSKRISDYPDMYSKPTDKWVPIRAIGVGTLRLDGWVSFDAGAKEGTLLTKPFLLEYGRLVLNASAPAGWLSVEITDPAGTALPGFSRSDCNTFEGDSLAHTVKWRNSGDLSGLVGRAVRLQFFSKHSKLFSFHLA